MDEAVDFVADVAEAASLAAVAVDGEVFAAQSLLHEIRHHAAVIQLQAGSVRVEDAHDARIDLVIAVIGHGYGLGEALGFVVDGTRADRIHVAPIGFFLGMFQRIAVALGGGRDEILRVVFERDVEGVKSSEGSDFQSGNSVDGVIHRAGGAGEVENEVDFADIERFADVLFYKLEARIMLEMIQIRAAAGEEVVDYNHTPAFTEEGIAEMGSQETGSAGDQCALWAHAFLTPFLTVPFFKATGTPSG